MNVVRSVVFVIWLYTSMALIGLTHMPYLAGGMRGAGVAAIRRWSKAAVWGAKVFCGIQLHLRGMQHLSDQPVLIAAKHQSLLDTLIPFLLMRDPAMVMKRELLRLPIYGWICEKSGMIPVDREAGMSALREMVKKAKAAIAAGRPVVIFPEGTRKYPGDPPDYQVGVAALYREMGVACLPVALNTGVFWPAHGITRKPGIVVWEFLEPIPPGLSRDAFMARLQDTIETGSNKLLAGQ